jgi:hypothetical protein
VQQRQYRVPAGLTVVLTVAGVIVVVIGAIVVPAAASQLQQGGLAGVVVGSILILAGALFIALGRRPETLTVDDEGLHLRTLTRTRVIPWSLVRSFRAQPGGRGWWFVRAELGTGKKVLLPGPQGSRSRTERIVAELTEVQAERLASGGD